MNLRLKRLLSKPTLSALSRLSPRSISPASTIFTTFNGGKTPSSPPFQTPSNTHHPKSFYSSPHLKFSLSTARRTSSETQDSDEEYEVAMNEFLSRFVHRMRGRLNEAYPQSDKPTIDAMLLVIVDKLVGQMEKGASLQEMVMSKEDLSEDLWRTVWEVSHEVYSDMEREKKKEKMKKFLQSEQVKALTRFASEVGVRGDMLHELRFKWAREAMEESEFYESLEKYREEEEDEEEAEEGEVVAEEAAVESGEEGGASGGGGGLPKRHGKIKYKLYGLDLSGAQWKEVADKIHEAGEVFFPQEAKSITGKCKLVTDKILGMRMDDDPQTLLNEWVELLQPNRVDWVSLLEKLREKDALLYLKIAEHVLDEPSFQADIQDYFKLIDIHATENRLEDAERLLKKMSEKGMSPDLLTVTSLVRMYSKAGNLERAKEAFESLKSLGFKPDQDIYSCMIMAYVNAGQPKSGEGLMREMETRDIKPSEEIHMALLRAFAQRGDVSGAQRIVTTMQFAGYQQTPESCILLVEACGKAGNPSEARRHFDSMARLGYKPDDRCTAIMISAYEKKNELDRALHLLLQLEKEGFEPGIATYSVLVDWLGKLQLVDEVEQMLGKIAQLGEAPPLKIQVSLCDMYSRAGIEKKALQALGVLEAKKDLLAQEDFERIIQGLIKGNFVQEAQRIHKLMEDQGFTTSESLNISLMATKTFGTGSGSRRRGKR
ncbi:hypothetical protein Cgig2_005445 [Carnegiea gigantea]|uniref:PROP1-like PPR domain-containing protein n=1 Tax=Carnegiea gigantea TaxID=171969 RepID=A0A9Q1QGA6_9CARY|nr:hypothetical protein Cgig2_005445 [Carnegiea gigantea]